MYKLLTTMYRKRASKLDIAHSYNVKKFIQMEDISRRNIEMFLLKIYPDNESVGIYTDGYESMLEYSFNMLSVLNNHLDRLIVLNTEEKLNILSENYCSYKIIDSKGSQLLDNKQINEINSLNCLFTWNLPHETLKKDMIIYIQNKYGNYNMDISQPVFTFERYISNIIIAFEVFLKGKSEAAKMIILLIDKWLDRLDKMGSDEFYLSISVGLKYVLTSMFVNMESKTDSTEHIKQLLDIIESLSCNMNNNSKSAVSAIQAVVLIEYGDDESHFKKAIECIQIACDLSPINSYWLYLHSLILTANRYFLQTVKSCSTENEQNIIMQAISEDEHMLCYIEYHRMQLLKDTVVYNYYANKNNLLEKNYISDGEKIVQMIKKIISMKPKNPLIIIACAKNLMTLPTIIHDSDLGKQLLIKGLQMAPKDLTVLKAVAQVIILSEKNIQRKITKQLSEHQQPEINKQSNMYEILQIAIEKHKKDEDPIPYLTSVLVNYDYHTKLKILAQICSYTIIYHRNLEFGIECFEMLSKAHQTGSKIGALISKHYSSFTPVPKIFNLAELLSNEIKLFLINMTPTDGSKGKHPYYNVLSSIMLVYNIDVQDPYFDRSMRSYLTREPKNKNIQHQQHDLKNNIDLNTGNINQNLSAKNMSASRNFRNYQNNANQNYVVDNNSNNDTNDVSVSDSYGDDNNNIYNNYCCTCRIM